MITRFLKNPVTKKRYLRFKSMKRAYVSFWIIVLLYGLSLVSELICNSSPLYIRYNEKSYFPVIKYYPESEFTGSGRKTRPDYKLLNQGKFFNSKSDNYMIFPPFPFDPFESINPETISFADEVTLRLSPSPMIATIDIKKDFTVHRAFLIDTFIDNLDKQITDDDINQYFYISNRLKQGVLKRFNNLDSSYEVFQIRSHLNKRYQVSLSTYKKRPVPPPSIRLTLKEIVEKEDNTGSIVFNRSLKPVKPVDAIWRNIGDDETQILLNLIQSRFEGPVDDYRLTINQRQFIASFIRKDVRFPYPPVKGHPLGVDSAGRDVLARILYGLRISLTFGLMLVGGSMFLGIFIGAIQGYYGGKLDITAQRMIEIWSALPFLYIMILMGSIYGRSFMLLLICYGLFNWVGISYYIRAEFLNLRKRPFVEAAKCMGVPSYKIIFKHILPNGLVPVITFFPFSLVGAIGALAALDYLGFGRPPPTPSWGELLLQAQVFRWAWWLILYPSLALFSIMLLGVFVGEGVRNAYDPRQYSRLE